jgi:leader peptidase (prepilin peptidase)/N-methyltransferase
MYIDMGIWPGLIWAVACGLAVGNYACSLVHRLPRGESLTFNRDSFTVKKPYCGSCGGMLATRDLFPVFSFLINCGKCRFCAAPIPATHMVTELFCAVLFATAYLQYGFTEPFILMIITGVLLIILSSIEVMHHYLAWQILLALTVTGMIQRTLVDQSIYGWVQGGVMGLLVGGALWRFSEWRKKEKIALPKTLFLWMIAGIYLPAISFFAFVLVYGGALLAGRLVHEKQSAFPSGIAFSVTLLLLLFFPV